MVWLSHAMIFIAILVPIKCSFKTDSCQNGGTYVADTGNCICIPGFTGRVCEFPFCNSTTNEIVTMTAPFAVLGYHYEYDNCHSITEQIVDSHVTLLEVEYRSLTENNTVTVIVTDPNGTVFTDYMSQSVTDGLSLHTVNSQPGKWKFLWNVLPYGGGCEIKYFGASDLDYLKVGLANSLQSDTAQNDYTDKTDYVIAQRLNNATVGELIVSGYSGSTSTTTFHNPIERQGCNYDIVFGPLPHCNPGSTYWLQISGVDNNNFTFNRVFVHQCISTEPTTTQSVPPSTSTNQNVECNMGDKPVVRTYDVSMKTLAFVIDTTATMAEDRKQIAAMFAQLPALQHYYSNYLVTTYNDPVSLSTTVYQTQKDMAAGLNYVANGNFTDGRDCPDYSLDGMFPAIKLSYRGSPIIVFTDSSSKDPEKQYKILKQLRIQRSQIFFVITGDCCGDCKMYEAIAEASMGRVFYMGKKEIGKISGLITSLGVNTTVLSMDSWPKCNSWDFRSSFFIDESIDAEFYFSVTGTSPTLVVLLDGYTVKEHKLLGKAGNNYVYSVANSTAGLYSIRLQTFDICYVQVWGRSTKQLQIGFVKSPNSDAETDFPLDGGGLYNPTLHAVGFDTHDLITNADITRQTVNFYSTATTVDRVSCDYEILLPDPFYCPTISHNYRLRVIGLLSLGTTFQRYAAFSCVEPEINDCLHGGTSYFGHCVCNNGFTGLRCELYTTSTAYVTSTSTMQSTSSSIAATSTSTMQSPSSSTETTTVIAETSTSTLQTSSNSATSESLTSTMTTTSPTVPTVATTSTATPEITTVAVETSSSTLQTSSNPTTSPYESTYATTTATVPTETVIPTTLQTPSVSTSQTTSLSPETSTSVATASTSTITANTQSASESTSTSTYESTSEKGSSAADTTTVRIPTSSESTESNTTAAANTTEQSSTEATTTAAITSTTSSSSLFVANTILTILIGFVVLGW